MENRAWRGIVLARPEFEEGVWCVWCVRERLIFIVPILSVGDFDMNVIGCTQTSTFRTLFYLRLPACSGFSKRPFLAFIKGLLSLPRYGHGKFTLSVTVVLIH